MRAPVYRHLDTRSGFFGLSFVEWGPILVVFWVGMYAHRPNIGLLVAAAAYAAVRAVGYGRAEGFLQHFALWQARQLCCGGRLSALARARVPRFPFAQDEYASRTGSDGGRGR